MIVATKNWKPVLLPLTGVGNLRRPTSPITFGEAVDERLVDLGLAVYAEEGAPASAPVPTPGLLVEALVEGGDEAEGETSAEDNSPTKKGRRAAKKQMDEAGS